MTARCPISRVTTEIAHHSGVTVGSVAYRLARNGVRFTVPVDDCHAAWTWLTAQRDIETTSLGEAGAGPLWPSKQP